MSRLKLVIDRSGLPATFCGALHYEDLDGDLVLMSSDYEVEYWLRIQDSDGKPLDLILSAAHGSLQTMGNTMGAQSTRGKSAEVTVDMGLSSSGSSLLSTARSDAFEMICNSDLSRSASMRNSVEDPTIYEIKIEYKHLWRRVALKQWQAECLTYKSL